MTQRHAFALSFVCFLVLETTLILFIDRPVSDFTRGLEITSPALIDFFRAITDFGRSKWYLWPSGIGLLTCYFLLRVCVLTSDQRQHLIRISHNLLFFFASIAVSGIATDIIKPIVGRARPVEMLREHIYGFQPFTFHAAWNGMPSGHATTAAALALALSLLFPRGRVLWFMIGVILAASRIMVNAHYLSDVLAGISVGSLVTFGINRLRTDQGMFPVLKGIFPIDKSSPLS